MIGALIAVIAGIILIIIGIAGIFDSGLVSNILMFSGAFAAFVGMAIFSDFFTQDKSKKDDKKKK